MLFLFSALASAAELQVGMNAGAYFPEQPDQIYSRQYADYSPYSEVGGKLGVQLGVYPVSFLGLELQAESMVLPADRTTAWLGGAHGSVAVRIPSPHVQPFVVGGYSLLWEWNFSGVLRSSPDPMPHWGTGVQVPLGRRVQVRAEMRHGIDPGSTGLEHHFWGQAGVSAVFGPKPKPVPTLEPVPDTDGDGWLDPDDRCPREPETVNGYLDADGCADEVPTKVQEFTGVIQGISFEYDRAELRVTDQATLQRAVGAMLEFPSLELVILGHTDNLGTPEYNLDLSQRRAEAVRQYLIDNGVAPSRLLAIGRGDREPVADNTTPEGQAQNRRVEFRLFQ